MIGQKVTTQSLRNLFSRVKSHLHSGYNHTKNFLGKVDHAVDVGKQIYNALEPVINHYVSGNGSRAIHNGVMKGLNGYESLRNKLIDHHEDAANHCGNVKRSLPGLL
jgi:hypothetical protein